MYNSTFCWLSTQTAAWMDYKGPVQLSRDKLLKEQCGQKRNSRGRKIKDPHQTGELRVTEIDLS